MPLGGNPFYNGTWIHLSLKIIEMKKDKPRKQINVQSQQ